MSIAQASARASDSIRLIEIPARLVTHQQNGHLIFRDNNRIYRMRSSTTRDYLDMTDFVLDSTVFQVYPPRQGNSDIFVWATLQSRSRAAASRVVAVIIYKRSVLESDEKKWIHVPFSSGNRYLLGDGQFLHEDYLKPGDKITVTLPPPSPASTGYLDVRYIQNAHGGVVDFGKQRASSGVASRHPGTSPRRR